MKKPFFQLKFSIHRVRVGVKDTPIIEWRANDVHQGQRELIIHLWVFYIYVCIFLKPAEDKQLPSAAELIEEYQKILDRHIESHPIPIDKSEQSEIEDWKLFLDDQAFDPETPDRWAPLEYAVALSSAEAIERVQLHKCLPSFVDFDHDLGGDDSAMKFLRWLEYNWDMSCQPFEYRIHSANPVGRDNIVSFMESWKKSRELP